MHRTHSSDRGRRLSRIAAATVVAVTFAACGGSDDGAPDASPADSAPAGSVATTAPTMAPATAAPTVAASTTPASTVAVPTSTAPPPTTAPADELAIAVQSILDEAMEPGAIDWSAGGVDAPPTLARAAVRVDGRADVFAVSGAHVDGSAPETDEPFLAASLTGSLSRAVAFQLIDEGLLDPAATIDTWAPDMPGAATTTVQQLVDVRTGWTRWTPAADGVIVEDFSRQWTLTEVMALVSADPAVTVAPEPTVANTDALTNDLVLGHVLQEVTGQSLPELVADRIAAPLGLDRTRVQDGATPVADWEAGVFVFDGSVTATSDFDATSYLTWHRATLAAVSSVPDLLDLLDAWHQGSLFDTDRRPGPERFGADRATAAANPTSYIGLGVPFNGYCPCEPEGDGNRVNAIGRSPGGLGTITYLYRYDDGISVVLHFNSDNVPDRSQLDALVARIHEAAVAVG